MHILISEMHILLKIAQNCSKLLKIAQNARLEMHNMRLDPSKMCTRCTFCPRRDAYFIICISKTRIILSNLLC